MDGVIVLDKPAGMTSHDALVVLKKVLRVRKAGHTGTLDPLATGVLPVCLNEATKLAPFLEEDRKEYRATMLLGVSTDTQDVEGRVVRQETPRGEPEVVAAALRRFEGVIAQRPPAFSAVKHQGKPLYRWARQGVAVQAPLRKVEIHRIVLETVALPFVTFRVACSRGTYIRTLCADAGEALGCGACLSALRRLRSGPFREEEAVPPRAVDPSRVMSMAEALSRLPAIVLDREGAVRLRNGAQPTRGFLERYELPFLARGDMVMFISPSRALVAVGRMHVASGEVASLAAEEPATRLLRVFRDKARETGEADVVHRQRGDQ